MPRSRRLRRVPQGLAQCGSVASDLCGRFWCWKRDRFRCGERADVAGELAAVLDEDLAVANLSRNLAAWSNDELLARRQFAFEAAPDLRDLDFHDSMVGAVLRNLDQIGRASCRQRV